MEYEELLEEADSQGLIVKEKPLKYNNGRIKGKKIAIRENIDTTAEKACVLAEELGHHYTTVGNILGLEDPSNRKQELRARVWGYDRLIGIKGIIDAFEAGCKNRFEISEYLGVTEEYLEECIEAYRSKYGKYTIRDGYIIYFIPNLNIGKIIDAI